ncbi:MAG: AAA family ATPase [Rhizobacter sp.]|nr:AAA family ATPase [Rhizobacter sp.]
MKIKVISADASRAEELADWVRASGPGLNVLSAEGTVAGLPEVINGSRPGLIVVDGVDIDGLDAIGLLANSHPEVDAIVISAEQSPAFLMKAMQAGVREVLLPPQDGAALQAAVQRMARKRTSAAPAPPAAPVQGEVLSFMGCKGGSGASFLAANLAYVLSVRDERSVALLDLDLQFGDTLLMLSDQRPTSDVAEVAANIGRLDEDLLRSAMVQISGKLAVLPSPDELSHSLEIKAMHIEAIIRQARQMFDFVVIDIGRSVDSVSLQALDMSDRIMPVLQLTVPQVRDAKRLRKLFRSLEYPAQKIHWVVNRYQKSGDISLDSVQQSLGCKEVVTVPNHFAGVSASINQGVPIEKLARNNPVARSLLELAQAIAPMENAKKERWLASLFGN